MSAGISRAIARSLEKRCPNDGADLVRSSTPRHSTFVPARTQPNVDGGSAMGLAAVSMYAGVALRAAHA
jgi:hypothetical protein